MTKHLVKGQVYTVHTDHIALANRTILQKGDKLTYLKSQGNIHTFLIKKSGPRQVELTSNQLIELKDDLFKQYVLEMYLGLD
jgi:hypothetical protein